MPKPLFDPACPPRRVLVVCTRRLGDVLLTTPLLRSLRRAWPQAELDVVTLQWSAPALAGNPDVSRLIALPESAGARETLRVIGPPRRYDLALSTLHSDRAHFIALWAAPRRVNVLPPAGGGTWWKARTSTRWTRFDGNCHAAVQYLRLADALGIARHHDVVPPRPAQPSARVAALAPGYAVLHPAPLYRYKRWTVAGWHALLAWLAARGLRVVLTGGPSEDERRYVAEVAAGAAGAVTNLAGALAFAELTELIERAAVFVGTDTSVTHLAAATGTPTVTPYGPTYTPAWGPWPRGIAADVALSPWQRAAPWQQCGNVWLLQGINHCVPCAQEGCERHRDSRADCLAELPASRVIAAVAQALAAAPARV